MKSYFEVYEHSLDAGVEENRTRRSAAMNACYECCDRHVGKKATALQYENDQGLIKAYSYEELSILSSRFGNFLLSKGVEPGDCVAALVPKTAELVIVALAAWRIGAVYQPLFTAFGPEAIEHRLLSSCPKVIIVDDENLPKLEGLGIGAAKVSIGASPHPSASSQFWEILKSHSDECPLVEMPQDAPFIFMSTSGTTGKAKALQVPLRALNSFKLYLTHAVGLTPEDRFWNLADPGWAYGLYYGLVGPLALGNSILFYHGAFQAEKACELLRRYRITNLAGTPTAFKLLMTSSESLVESTYHLQRVSSAGEISSPAIARWFKNNLAVIVHDHYGQTELGMILCNHHALAHPLRSGSAGVPAFGHKLAILNANDGEAGVGVTGMLAVDKNSSPQFWFSGYLIESIDAPVERYYRTGDLGILNDDKTISMVGRADDVITTSGYPRQFSFVEQLPKTASGKIQRAVLRARSE